jgi:hypothetical protein
MNKYFKGIAAILAGLTVTNLSAQQNKLTTLTELVNTIADKWKAKQK